MDRKVFDEVDVFAGACVVNEGYKVVGAGDVSGD